MDAEGWNQHTCTEQDSCRELKTEDERMLIDINLVRNIIIGLSDGLTVPFGLTAGLSSLGSSKLVVIAGLAELISGAISMGIGGYLASEADRDQFRYRQKIIRNRVSDSCSGEMGRQVQSILGPFGISHGLCSMVANDLLKFEYAKNTPSSPGQQETTSTTDKIVTKTLFSNFFGKLSNNKMPEFPYHSTSEKINDEETVILSSTFESETLGLGMTEFLLKFGEGVEEVSTLQLYISAFTIGFSYFIGGLIPMAPYFFVEKANVALFWSVGVMVLTLLVFGSLKAYFTGARIGFIGYLKGSLSTILVGGGAAAASYWVVKLLDVKT